MHTILIIEDDQRLAQLLRTGIEEAGHHVLLAYDAEMALRIMALHKADIEFSAKGKYFCHFDRGYLE